MFIRYQVQPIKGFVYESVRFSPELPATIVATVVPRAGSQARCSGCGRAGPTYDHAARLRVWTLPPLFKFTLALVYTMRRVKCPACGVVVEKVPWATGKHSLCDGFRLLLARWARKLSWDETADGFHVSWADVYGSVQWVVEYGFQPRALENIRVIGIDEICVRVGRGFWTLIYQIDEGLTRLLWGGARPHRADAAPRARPLGPRGLRRHSLRLPGYVAGLHPDGVAVFFCVQSN